MASPLDMTVNEDLRDDSRVRLSPLLALEPLDLESKLCKFRDVVNRGESSKTEQQHPCLHSITLALTASLDVGALHMISRHSLLPSFDLIKPCHRQEAATAGTSGLCLHSKNCILHTRGMATDPTARVRHERVAGAPC